ncbi:integral membrane protein (possible accessory factor in peptide antibiotic secretion) [Bacillus mycoides]|uniref:stage II sporulation protein M n=1 Tax=Bacillus mycoides TaxID=1405 RepID=UPI0007AB5AEC|nr:stage II sporulation protein M [Bacillus mycoides]KZE06702.1 integral membrane protein (possible accessory factor in peptide antibiotic secretion) [Bacillus mycoides]SCC63204.1 Integral membrane protein (Possible accessory factor in peptide antibiotic secretion) [Bacillus mycoides]
MKKIDNISFYKHLWFNYSRKIIFISLVFMSSCLWGAIFQGRQNVFPPNPPDYTWLHYFSHNTSQSLFCILVGLLTYGIGSIILLIMNGTLIGIILQVSIQNDMGVTIFTAFLPHGIFEVPAMVLTCLYPYILWNFIIKSIKHRKIHYKLINKEIVPVPLLIILLLFIAAIMESTFGI